MEGLPDDAVERDSVDMETRQAPATLRARSEVELGKGATEIQSPDVQVSSSSE